MIPKEDQLTSRSTGSPINPAPGELSRSSERK
jgi:hypothetical protein